MALRSEQVHGCLDTAAASLAQFRGSHGHKKASRAEASQQYIVTDAGAQSSSDAARQNLGSRPAPKRKHPLQVYQVDPDQRDLLPRLTALEKSRKGVPEGVVVQQAGLRVIALIECRHLQVELSSGTLIP
jgi:hypothetical protein